MHDITAARVHALPALYPAAAAGLPAWPIPAMKDLASACTSRSSSPLAVGNSTSIPHRNAVLRSMRCLDERGFALLTGRWRTLQHITASPSKIGDIAAPLSS